MAFDRARIHVKAGDGGNGVVSFRREKFVPYGGPDGGDGGRGGSVYLVGEPSMSTMASFARKRHFKAGRGGHGAGRRKQGAKGEDVRIRVPLGTIVRTDDGEVIADIVAPGQAVLVARGGRGGLGNTHFATPTNQAPRIAQKGEPGEERWLNLEMKLIADIGLIGFPNAGKSTFLAAVSRATPKIADYPFTTLVPNLGVAMVDDDAVVLADIPGLIEGAHEGKGLGHEFLRHIERTKVLIHLIDGSEEDVRKAYDSLNEELALYNPSLAEKPQIVVINKIDQPEVKESLEEKLARLADLPWPVMAASALTGEGTREVLLRAHAKLAEVRAAEPQVVMEEVKVFRPRPVREPLVVTREDNAWRVSGRRVERAVVMTDFSLEEGVRFLYRQLARLGVTEALLKAGAKPGDVVRVGNTELEWWAGEETEKGQE